MKVEIDKSNIIKAAKAERDSVYKLCGMHCYYLCVSPEKQVRDKYSIDENLFIALNGSGKALIQTLHPETDLIEVSATMTIN